MAKRKLAVKARAERKRAARAKKVAAAKAKRAAKAAARSARAARKRAIGSRASVMTGKKIKTKTGLTRALLMRSKSGKVVTKKAHAAGVKKYRAGKLPKWTAAVVKARKELGAKKFVAINSKKHPLGPKLYALAKKYYGK